jgi:hypothetical protein
MQNNKSIVFLLSLFIAFGLSLSLSAQTGFNASYAILSINGGGDAYYDLNAATGNPDFQGNNLGFFTPGNSLVVKSAENNVYKCGTCDIWQTKVHYRVFKTGDTPPSFSEHTVGYTSGFNNGCGGADQRWSTANGMTNLLSGLSFGCYTFQIYTSLQYQFCGNGTTNNDNGGNYFSATFTYWAGTGELCNGLDDDCDGSTDEGLTFTNYYTDSDDDNYGTGGATSLCADPGMGFALNNLDCNDADGGINPGATEACNFVDDDCDTNIDEGFPLQTYYQDADNDGRGNPGVTTSACAPPAGYVSNNNDCDDSNTAVCPKPSGLSTNNITDVSAELSWTGLPCADQYRLEYRRRSGTAPIEQTWTIVYTTENTYMLTELVPEGIKYQWRVATICTPGVMSAQSGYAAPIQVFNTKYKVYTDADGDGFGDAGASPVLVTSIPQEGFSSENNDCDDSDMAVFPGAVELCNETDDDCDAAVDEGVTPTWYIDTDNDGLGSDEATQVTCVQPEGYVGNNVDCDDDLNTSLCPLPEFITVEPVGLNGANVSWTGSDCATGYNYMYRDPLGVWSAPSTTTNTSFSLSGLSPASQYLTRIRTRCASPNPEATSAWVYFTIVTGLPMGLTENSDPQQNSTTSTAFALDIYPNPGNGIFNIRLDSNTDEQVSITVLDGIGKQVYTTQWTVFEGQTIDQVDLSHLANGVYQVQVRHNDQLLTRKVVMMK